MYTPAFSRAVDPIHAGGARDLLSFLMTVVAPREVGLQEIRVEPFPPADEESAELLERLAAA